jgi:hypothetical protein
VTRPPVKGIYENVDFNAPPKADFRSEEWFWNVFIPAARKVAKGEGGAIQFYWNDQVCAWGSMDAVGQPTGRAFGIVHPDGRFEKGPRFDTTFLTKGTIPASLYRLLPGQR